MDDMINSKLWTIVHKSRVHDKFTDCKLLLSDSNWNDNGYYTLFQLWLQLPEKKEVNLKIAELNILNIGQKAGENPIISTTSSMFTFIRDIESAYMILFNLTFKERKELRESLNVHFQYETLKNEPAFQKSVLRGTNEIDFKKLQGEIERIITCPLDISTALIDYKKRLNIAF